MKAFIDYETARYSGFVDFRKAMLSTTSVEKFNTSGFIDFRAALAKAESDHWMLSIADRWTDHIAQAVQGALQWVVDQAAAVVAQLGNGPTAAADAVPDVPAGDITSAVSRPFAEAGQRQVQEVAGGDKRIDVSFDMRNAKVSAFIDNYTMNLIREISDSTREAIRSVVVEGEKVGASTQAMSRSIRDVIGLTASQGAAVESYRQSLTDLDPEVLDRALRDQRSDGRIQRAIDAGEPLAPEDVDRLTAGYAKRWLAYRAESIARTEGLRSATYGSFASMAAMLDEPDMQGMTVSKKWVTTVDKATRQEHKEMSGVTVIGLDTPFELPDCEMLVPHDSGSNIPGSETINCRCCVSYRVVKEPNN